MSIYIFVRMLAGAKQESRGQKGQALGGGKLIWICEEERHHGEKT